MKSLIFLLSFTILNMAVAEEIHIEVNGMVCAFCSNGIEKKFNSRSEVESVKVDLSEKLVTVKVKENQTLSDEDLKELITSSGYDLVSIHRMD